MKEALKLALEALESGVKTTANRISWTEYDCELMEQAITAIKEALTQPDYRAVKTYHEGKPVYVSQPEQELEYCVDYHCAGDCGQPHNQQERQAFLVAQPLQRPWVGLTDEEIDSLQRLAIDPVDASGWGFLNRERYARLIEAKLKEKNT